MIQPLLTKSWILWLFCLVPIFASGQITGDRFVCPLDNPHSYTAPSQAATGVYTWTLPDGGGTIISYPNVRTVTLDWTGAPGMYRVVATYNFTNANTEAVYEYTVRIEETVAMACNNVVNISMDIGCEVEFTADMLLEDPEYPNSSFDIIVENANTGELIDETVLDGAYVGTPLKVQVKHRCSGNSCWSLVNLEDKYIPDLICNNDITVSCTDNVIPDSIGFPLPEGTLVTPAGNNQYFVGGFDQCGTALLEYRDSISERTCNQGLANIIFRIWRFTDVGSHSTACTDQIFVTGPDASTVEFPEDWDGPTALRCRDKDLPDGWIANPDGTPSPATTGSPFGAHCATIQISYFDSKFSECGANAFKLKRLWHIIDWCTGDVLTHNQLISVVDLDPPICVSGDTELIVHTTPGDCVTSFNVPAPTIIFECSDYTVSVGYKNRSNNDDPFTSFTRVETPPNSDGSFTIPSIEAPQDSIWIIYIVTDICGNEVLCLNEAQVIDKEEPVPVCDQFTAVSLNSDGWAFADIYALDDGSVDNCSIDYMEVRRISGTCGEFSDWGPKVKFCCNDVGTNQMVELRVVDHNGNSNSCMVEVDVQDNNPLNISECPDDQTIPCGADITDLSQYGVPPVGSTVCGNANVDMDVTVNINDCGVGSVVRRFTVESSNGNTRNCTQTITVGGNLVFSENNIVWPQDLFVRDCPGGSDINPDNLSSEFVPSFSNDLECSNIVMDYKDVSFQYVEDVCVKILREWTIINWCQFDPFDQTAGTFTYSQVIKINDETPPMISNSCEDRVICGYDEGCEGSISLVAKGVDLCTPVNDLQWSYKIDLDNDGTYDIERAGRDATGVYPYGTHKVHFTVEDACGNINDDCSYRVTVEDCKDPTPYCLTELVTVIMEVGQSTEIWASDFGLNSFDNCTAESDLKFSFSPNQNEASRKITCDDLEGDRERLFNYEIYVTDEAGNQEFCFVTLKVQDNQGYCTDAPGEGGPDDEEPVIDDCGDDPITADVSASRALVCPGQDVLLSATNVSGCSDSNRCTLTWLDYQNNIVGTGNTASVLGGSTDEENVYTLIPVYSNDCDTTIVLGTVSFGVMNEGTFALPDTLMEICVNLIDGEFSLGDNFSGVPGTWSGDIINEDGNISFHTGTGSGSQQVTFTSTGVCAGFSDITDIILLDATQADLIDLDTLCQSTDTIQLDSVFGVHGLYFIDGVLAGQSGTTLPAANIDLGAHTLEFFSNDVVNDCLYGSTSFLVSSCDSLAGDNFVATVGGMIYTASNQLLTNVTVILHDPLTGEMYTSQTSESGEYTFSSIDMYENYAIAPTKEDSYLNGISTLDLVLIQNHILGLRPFDSPYNLIAADVNESASITASDLVLIRKLILGINETLPGTTAWKFIDANNQFEQTNNPFPHREFILVNDLAEDMMDNNFVAVKMGDVNGTADLNVVGDTENRSDNTIRLTTTNAQFKQGDVVSVPLHLSDGVTLAGYQASLAYTSALELMDVSSTLYEVGSEFIRKSEGVLQISWNTDQSIRVVDDALVVLTFVAKQDGELSSDLTLGSTNMESEVYIENENNYDARSLVLDINEAEHNTQLILYQNVPNPFADHTMVKFYLPYDSEVSIRILDLTGKVVFENKNAFLKGENVFDVDMQKITSTGILYYQIETSKEISNRKMIKLN